MKKITINLFLILLINSCAVPNQEEYEPLNLSQIKSLINEDIRFRLALKSLDGAAIRVNNMVSSLSYEQLLQLQKIATSGNPLDYKSALLSLPSSDFKNEIVGFIHNSVSKKLWELTTDIKNNPKIDYQTGISQLKISLESMKQIARSGKIMGQACVNGAYANYSRNLYDCFYIYCDFEDECIGNADWVLGMDLFICEVDDRLAKF